MKKFELYNQNGQVEDPEIARKMAEAQEPYMKKSSLLEKKITLSGLVDPNKEKRLTGQTIAEKVGENLIQLKREEEKERERQERLSDKIKDLSFIIRPVA